MRTTTLAAKSVPMYCTSDYHLTMQLKYLKISLPFARLRPNETKSNVEQSLGRPSQDTPLDTVPGA